MWFDGPFPEAEEPPAVRVRYRPRRRRPRRPTAGRPVRPRQRPVARDDRRSPRTAAATAPSTCCARPPRSTCAPSSRRSPPAPPRRARWQPRSATSTPSFMDEEAVEALGVTPLADDLAQVAAVTDAGDVVALSGALGRAGVLGLVIPFVNTDDRDPEPLRGLPRAGRARAARRVVLPRGRARRQAHRLRRARRADALPRRLARPRGRRRCASWRSRPGSPPATGTR